MFLRDPNAPTFVQPRGLHSIAKPKSLGIFSYHQSTLDLTCTHSFTHKLTERSHMLAPAVDYLGFSWSGVIVLHAVVPHR